jgi:hypothetical protein
MPYHYICKLEIYVIILVCALKCKLYTYYMSCLAIAHAVRHWLLAASGLDKVALKQAFSKFLKLFPCNHHSTKHVTATYVLRFWLSLLSGTWLVIELGSSLRK